MWIKILLLFFVFSFLFRTDTSFDQDLGRHLKIGEIILQTKNIPLTNLFSYTYPDFPFINSHWLFEVLVYLGQQTIGLQTVLVLKVIFILIAVWLILETIPKKHYLLLPIGFIFLHTLRERPELRPEILSFLFTGLTVYILDRFEKTRSRLVFTLPLIQLIWVNSHVYFIVGIFLQAIFLLHLGYLYLRSHLESGKLKLLGIIFVLSLAATLINPSGIKGFLNPFTFNQNYGYTIVENQTMFLLESINFRDPNFLFVKLSLGLVALSLLTALIRRRFVVKNILLAIAGAALALLHVRSFPYLVFLSLPAVLQNFGPIKKNRFFSFLLLVTCVLLLLESFFYLNGDYYKYRDDQAQVGLEFKENVKGAMDFVLANNLPQPIFNNFDIGSYISYRGWPKYRVFVDGRPGEYPKEFFLNTYIPMQSDYSKFKDFEKQLGFETIIFSHTDQTPWGRNFLQNVIKDEVWKLVYIDDFMVVLTTQDAVNQKKLPVIDLSKLTTESYKFNNHVSYLRLGLFLLNNQYIEGGRKFIEKTLQLFPNDPIANQIIGNSQRSQTKFFW